MSGAAVTYHSSDYIQANRWDKRNLRIVQDTVAPQPGERLLEVGCGRGHMVKALRAERVDARGVDLNPTIVEHGVVPEHLGAMSADDLRFDDGAFDVVISFHMIEHVPSVPPVLAELVRVLRPGGRLLMVYPREPVRGLFATGASWVMYGHPFRARHIHRHTVRPRTLEPALSLLGMTDLASRFLLLTTPQFTTVGRKREA